MEKLYVLIKVAPGHIEDTLDEVLHMKNVMEASAVTGSYDIIVKIEGVGISEILSTVIKDIHGIEGIIRTETLVAVEI